MPVQDFHPEYLALQDDWQLMRDLIAGERTIKDAGPKYLPLPSGLRSDDPRYLAYVARNSLFNATARTADAFKGMISRKAPDIQVPTAMAPLLLDITLSGMSIEEVSVLLTEELLTVYFFGILVDFPAVAADLSLTRAQVEDLNLRPFWKLYRAEAIRNWRFGRINNVTQLVEVRLTENIEEPQEEEFEYTSIQQIRVLDLQGQDDEGEPGQYRQRLYRYDPRDQKWKQWGEDIIPLRNNEPLQWLPFTTIPRLRPQRPLSKPVLLDLANVNLSHYCTLADLEQSCHEVAIPVRYFFGAQKESVPDVVGPGEIWHHESPDIKAGVIEVSGAGIGHIETRDEKKREYMAHLGARLLSPEKRAVEAVETHQIRSAGEHSALSTIVHEESDGLTTALEMTAQWMGVEGDITVALNTDFFPAPLSPQELAVLLQWVQSGEMTAETAFWNLQQGEWIPPNVTFEEEKKKLDQRREEEMKRITEQEPPKLDEGDIEVRAQFEQSRTGRSVA